MISVQADPVPVEMSLNQSAKETVSGNVEYSEYAVSSHSVHTLCISEPMTTTFIDPAVDTMANLVQFGFNVLAV